MYSYLRKKYIYVCIQQYFLSINANKMYYRINSPWLINVVLYLFTTRNAEEDFIHNSLTDMGLITTFFCYLYQNCKC